MLENNENFYEDNLFKFENDSCDCAEDVKYISPGRPPETTIKIQAMPGNKIHFAFAPLVGLVRLGKKGAIAEKNLLGSLISIKNNDTTALFEYFKKNGFLFKISDTEYEPIDTQKMFEMIRRLRTTVELLSALGAIRHDYEKILGLSLYLLLSNPIEISFSTMEGKPYTTCSHNFLVRLKAANALPQPDYYQQQLQMEECVTVADTIKPPYFQYDTQLYMDIWEGSGQECFFPGSSSHLFRMISLLYAHGINEAPEIRKTVDLLFHYFHDVGIIKSVKENGSIEYYGKTCLEKFTKEMKERTMEIAQLVIAEEINANMSGIHPVYDARKMMPSWQVETLLSGLYFSIFYMKPDLELFRRCKECGQFFTVKATSTRKVFCGDSCRNRYHQSLHRKRKREREENN